MLSLTTRFRYWLPLLALLLAGACQRASYSFQTTTSALPPFSAGASGSVVLAPVAAVPSSARTAFRPSASLPQLRHTRAAARHLPKPLAQLRQQLPRLARQAAPLPRSPSQRIAGQDPLPGASPMHRRTKGIALLLAFFLGGLGGHLFYLGYYGRGVAYLAGTLVGGLLVIAAFVVAIASIYGGGASFVALATTGAILSSVVGALALVDAIRIAIGDLKPKNGQYFPNFFQTYDQP